MIRSIYLDREDAKKVENEESNIFVRSILEKIGVPLKDIWPEIELNVKQKVLLRDLLIKLDIEIINNFDREYEIYCGDNLLAKWSKPKFILREDKKARNPNKRFYYEMVINTWSVFDQEEKSE